MFAVLGITFPIFALIGLGFGLTRRGMFEARDMGAFGAFTVNVAMPALVFAATTSRPLGDFVDPGYIIAYVLATFATMALALGALTVAGFRGARRGVGVLGVCSSNSAYVGYPIMMLAYPQAAGTVLALQLIIEMFVSVPAGIMAAETSSPRIRTHFLRLVAAIVMGILRRPMMQAVILGVIWNLSGLPVPAPIASAVHILSQAASAIALFYIGGVLAGLKAEPGNGALAAIVVTVKLIAMPLFGLLFVHLAPMIGLPAVAPDLAMPLVVAAAMPMMAIYPALARDYGGQDVAALSLLIATIAAFFTLTALLTALHPIAG